MNSVNKVENKQGVEWRSTYVRIAIRTNARGKCQTYKKYKQRSSLHNSHEFGRLVRNSTSPYHNVNWASYNTNKIMLSEKKILRSLWCHDVMWREFPAKTKHLYLCYNPHDRARKLQLTLNGKWGLSFWRKVCLHKHRNLLVTRQTPATMKECKYCSSTGSINKINLEAIGGAENSILRGTTCLRKSGLTKVVIIYGPIKTNAAETLWKQTGEL